MERLRAAINWGISQTLPLFVKSPFHRFGVQLNKKGEVVRDRRLSRDEEKRLVDTALGEMNTAAHQHVGDLLHDRIIAALELCCRRGEILLIQNKRVQWDTCQIGILGSTAKDKENCRIPFNPRTAGGDPQAAVGVGPRGLRVREHHRNLPADDSDGLGNAKALGERDRAAGGRGRSEVESRGTTAN